MRRKILILLATVALAGALPATTMAASPVRERLNMYVLEGAGDVFGAATAGIELLDIRYTESAARAEAVLSRSQVAKLRAQGLEVRLVRNEQGQTAREQARIQALNGFTVWRPYDGAGGIREQLYDIARRNPQLVKLVVLDHTYQGREIIALKLTQSANTVADGSRPAVLYSSLQHAREWISGEVNLRTLRHFVNRWRANDKAVKNLLKTSELWFVVVANPDGYQYTHDTERLWRKNLRDNDDNGQITLGDGVDPNRNFADHWGYDNEGSSPDPFSDTYRGPSPASEPETQALAGLIDSIRPKFMSNVHSFGEWILYAQGWQVGTLDADNPIYVALAGTDADPAIAGFNPGHSADTLYVTNGETTDYADTRAGTIAFTPELGEGLPGAGFVFPDDEALVQAEFQKVLPFHLALARSASDADDPVSPVGIALDPFYLDQDALDPQHSTQTLFDFSFSKSHGDPQEVRVLAKRSLGDVTVHYSINGDPAQSGPTDEWNGGERYGPGNGSHYHVVTGTVTGTSPGDSVEVWFEGGGQSSDSFTYEVVSDSGNRTLILAAEDYDGASPVKAGVDAPQYLSFYEDALAANAVDFDVYDVDGNGRVAPDNLGVLSHYDAVLWYTGDDVVTREPGWGPGNASRLGMQELFEVRDFLNEGGRVLYTGNRAGQQYTTALGGQFYDPFENQQCSGDPEVEARCLPTSGSGNNQNDVIEYWLGAAITIAGGGIDPNTGDAFPVQGIDEPLDGFGPFGFNGADSAQNQNAIASFITTSDYLEVTDPAGSFPHFESWPSAEYVSGIAGPFDPHTGVQFMWSQTTDEGYKRLARTIDVPAGGATLSFWTSYNLEVDFDYMIIEAHTVGQDNWTTLPDLNGHTTSDLSNDQACPGGWSDPANAEDVLHPFLQHYQTFDPATGTCSSTGTTGQWNAANGPSGGWQQFQVDLSGFASQQVEVAITVVSDWGFQAFPGVFVDDIEVSTGQGSTSFEDDGDPQDGWTVTGAPQDPDGIEGANLNDWTRRGGFGIKEGAAITTGDTVYLGFGVEGAGDALTREQLLDRIVDHLLN